MALPCDGWSTTPSTVALLALLAEREGYKICRETLALEKQCILGLAADAKELGEKLGEREKADTASKTTSGGLMKRAAAADKHVVRLKTKLAIVKDAHTRQVDVSARAEEHANKARSELRDLQRRFLVVVGEEEVPNESLEEVQQQAVKLTKAAKELSRHLTELSGRTQVLETNADYLQLQLGKVAKACDDAVSSAHGKGRHAGILEF